MARGQNIINKVFNKPLLITAQDLQPITDYLSDPTRVAALRLSDDYEDDDEEYSNVSIGDIRTKQLRKLGVNPDTMTGQLNIDGVLVNRKGQMNAQCAELTSYQKLKEQFEAQVAEGITSCVLMVSSGGGEAFGAFSTASYVKKIAKQNNIKLTTYINGSACSAAYVWAAIADEIVSHPQGQSGSIGVVVQLYNDSKMLEKEGIKRSFVYAGGNKIPFDNDGEFTDKFLSDLQKSVDKTYMKFVDYVVSNRPMSKEEVINTNASVFDSDDALTLKLIDKVMELEDFEVEYGLKNKTGTTGKSEYHRENPPVEQELSFKLEEKMSKELLESPVSVELLQAQLTTALQEKQELASQFEAVQEKLSSLEATKETLEASVAQLMQEKEALEQASAQAAHLAKMEKRKEMLASVLGKDNEKLDALVTSTEKLEDDAFALLAESFGVKQEQQAKEFEEKGGEGAESPTQEKLEMSLGEKIAQRVKKSI